MQVSIIIVNWNTRELLADCIQSIYASPPEGKYDIWVVDNFSSDGSSAMIRENYPSIKLIENDKNLGFARANNQALRRSQGEYVLLLNPDTVVKSNAISKLIHFLDNNPDAGIAGPRLINPDGTLQISAFPFPTLFREFWRMFHLDSVYCLSNYPMNNWNQDQARDVDTLLGACMLIRRDAINQSGLFDEKYFIYSEEVDLCIRLNRSGWRLYWVPRAVVVHHGGKSTQQVSEEMFLRLYEGKVLLFRKHHSKLSVFVYKLILFAATLTRLVLTPIALVEEPAKRDEHLSLSNSYRRLFWLLPDL